MEHMVELRKVRNILGVGFQNISRFQYFDTVFVDDRYLILEEERVNALVLIIRSHGNKQEAEGVHLSGFQRPKQMVPSEG